ACRAGARSFFYAMERRPRSARTGRAEGKRAGGLRGDRQVSAYLECAAPEGKRTGERAPPGHESYRGATATKKMNCRQFRQGRDISSLRRTEASVPASPSREAKRSPIQTIGAADSALVPCLYASESVRLRAPGLQHVRSITRRARFMRSHGCQLRA